MMHHISFCTFYYYIVNHHLINRFIITSKLFIFIRIIEKITTIFVSSFPTERMPRGGRRPGAGRKSDAQREIVAAESARKRQRIEQQRKATMERQNQRRIAMAAEIERRLAMKKT